MYDNERRVMAQEINHAPTPEGKTLAEVQKDYKITGFAAPFVMVTRLSDGAKGSMMFKHSPRVYFDFEAAE